MQRVNRENRCHKGATPDIAIPVRQSDGLVPRRARASRHLEQQDEKQKHHSGVENNTCKMMSSGILTVDLAVEHMRNRGKRMPVVGMSMSKRPLNSGHGNAAR